MIKKKSLYITVIFVLLLLNQPVQAINDFTQYFSLAMIDNGAYLGSLDDQFHVSFPAQTYNNSINVYISDSEVAILPKDVLLSKVYSYYILSKTKPNNEFELAVRFDSNNIYAKNIWLFDFKKNQWHKLDTRVDWPGKLAIATTDFNYGKIALIEDQAMKYEESCSSYFADDNEFQLRNLEGTDLVSIAIENYNTALYLQEYERVSDIYQYDIKTTVPVQENFELVFSYQIADWRMPTVFYWDKNLVAWQEMETTADFDQNEIIVRTKMPYSRIALFMKPDVWAGEASWYRYKGCNCAASRDYPKDTELEITHLSSGKKVNVIVNDYGPELWTERIIDFDATVFEQFGSLRWGVTDVKIELIQ
ncbi:MAG: septal ring lytic transglycosylase RlpA family protein [Candidatus Komeilibacteria bacterium]